MGFVHEWQQVPVAPKQAAQYAAAAERVPAHHHVVMLDSADAFAQGSEADVLAAFRRASGGRPIVLGLETGCPKRRCTPAPPAGGRPLGRAGPAGIPWLSYINGGFVMGKAWAAARLWRSTASNGCCGANKKFSAQLGIGRFARANEAMVAFDHAQELIAHVISSAKDNQWRAHYATAVRAPPRRRPRAGVQLVEDLAAAAQAGAVARLEPAAQ